MITNYTIKQCLALSVINNDVLEIKGWVRTRRDSKAGISFLHINDGSCLESLQLVIPGSTSNYTSDVLKLTTGCAITATGTLVASQGKGQSYELQVLTLTVVGWVENPDTYPIQPKHHTMEYLREVVHLRPRTNIIGSVTRVRHCLAMAIHRFFHERHFFWVNTPIITSIDCEGAGELFRVSTLDFLNIPKAIDNNVDFKEDFFGKETFLTVSGQLDVEAYCLAMSKVYTFGPTFRAENSNTSRHLAEFWMIEPEIAFADLNDIIQLSKELLMTVLETVFKECASDMQFFNQFVDTNCIKKIEDFLVSSFEIITYTDAVGILSKCNKKFNFPVHWGLDLQSEHERYLAEEFCKKPVIVIDYPKEIKGFYMRLNDDGRTVAAMDVLAPGIGEIIGGSQREERLHILDQRMVECNLDQASYDWYRDLRRYGSVPHAGFGLGFERLISYVTGMNNVRDVIPYPRTPGNVQG